MPFIFGEVLKAGDEALLCGVVLVFVVDDGEFLVLIFEIVTQLLIKPVESSIGDLIGEKVCTGCCARVAI